MHILELPSFFPPHGGLFCLEQAKALKAIGHEVRIVSIVELGLKLDRGLYLSASWHEQLSDMDGIDVYKSYMRALPKAVRSNTERWINACCQAVGRYMSRYGKPDVLHAHCCKSAGLAAQRISQRYGIPYFITEHLSSGLFHRDFGQGWQKNTWLKESMKEAYESARQVMPVSLELVDDLAPFFGKRYPFTPVSNIIDTSFFSYRQRDPLKGRHFRFCCLAIADIYGKGYDILASALEKLDGDTELDIAGSGTDSEPMQQLFSRFPNVRLHGYLDKEGVRRLLWQSDALVLPSRSEAQPLVVLEAMSTGIPVVTTPSTPASLRIPGGCLLTDTYDAMALASKMLEAMSIPPSRRLSVAVSEMASPEVVARQLTEIFETGLL